jgi:Cu+-exporting ATPase
MSERLVLQVEGMTCSLCCEIIERELRRLDGIVSGRASFAAENVLVDYDIEKVGAGEIRDAVERVGFRIRAAGERTELERIRRVLVLSLVIGFPLFVTFILNGLGACHDVFDPASETWASRFLDKFRYLPVFIFFYDWRVQFALATPVQLFCVAPFYRHAWFALRSRRLTMDVLVALGTMSSYLFSLYLGIQGWSVIDGYKRVHFECAAMIVSLVLLGKYLEARARKQTRNAIASMAALQSSPTVVVRNGQELEISATELEVGELAVVKPGSVVPADGVVEAGHSLVDESLLTGESLPIERSVGDSVTGGTLAVDGMLRVRVTSTGAGTRLGRILRLVEEAQASKAPIQRLADRTAALFVPFVIATAIATFFVWYFVVFGQSLFTIELPILYAVAVLVVSCPCALGLATPAALVAGLGTAAKRGILVKSGEALEALAGIREVVFDKTGTLTLGMLSVADVQILSRNRSRDDLLRLVGIAQKSSNHPVSTALHALARPLFPDGIPEPQAFSQLPGKGVEIMWNGVRIAVGNEGLLAGSAISPETDAVVRSQRELNRTVVLVVVDGQVEAVIALADTIRPEASQAVGRIKALGIRVQLLTGDHEITAAAVADKVGIESFQARLLPEDKAREVARLRTRGVLMVGDGINDAPALAAATVGAAFGGTDLARDSGDIVVLAKSLVAIAEAIEIARRTLSNVKQNLAWAFAYNLLGISGAATGYLSPEAAAAGMAASSTIVVLNSLRLRRFKVR